MWGTIPQKAKAKVGAGHTLTALFSFRAPLQSGKFSFHPSMMHIADFLLLVSISSYPYSHALTNLQSPESASFLKSEMYVLFIVRFFALTPLNPAVKGTASLDYNLRIAPGR